MRKLAWCTDIHLNFIDTAARQEAASNLAAQGADGILITGDSAEAPDLIEILRDVYTHSQIPIYYVLGNHDYYMGSIAECQQECKKNSYNGLNYLPFLDFVILNHETCLIGVDNWYDVSLGESGHIFMNDWNYIQEFKELRHRQSNIDAYSKKLAREANEQLLTKLTNTVLMNPDVKRILIAMHVPPFRQTSLYDNKVSDFRHMPYFCSPTTGRVLKKFCKMHPTINFEVYCGHTHHRAFYQALPNLTARCGQAEYYQPQIEDLIQI